MILYVARIPFNDGPDRHVVCYLGPINDGAMYEFRDPLTHECVGSVGRENLAESVTPAFDWLWSVNV